MRPFASTSFDNFFLVEESRIIKSTGGLFISLPARKQIDGTQGDIVFLPTLKRGT
jgi:DNA-binding cell septation regulator SpoVG